MVDNREIIMNVLSQDMCDRFEGCDKCPYGTPADCEDVPNCFAPRYADLLIEHNILPVKEAPVADVAPVKHGEWKIVYQNEKATVYECSECEHLTFGTSDYCICGAKMDGESGAN